MVSKHLTKGTCKRATVQQHKMGPLLHCNLQVLGAYVSPPVQGQAPVQPWLLLELGGGGGGVLCQYGGGGGLASQ